MDTDPISLTFAALANPTRRAIIARLAQGNATVNELAQPFDISLPAISKHISMLESAGLILREREAQFRRCSLNPDAFKAMALWVGQYREIWDTRFDVMDEILIARKE